MNNIEREIDKILQKKGVAQPGISSEQFIKKLHEKLDERIPLMLETTVNETTTQIINDELERMGRGEPCKFWRYPRRCISFQREVSCFECTSYKPRSRWRRLFRYSAVWEGFLILMAATGLIAAIFGEEIRLHILCIWLGIIVISRFNVYWLYRELMKSLFSRGTIFVWGLKRWGLKSR